MMKKLYLLLVALTIAFGASAGMMSLQNTNHRMLRNNQVVKPAIALDEFGVGKQVADVRYYNLAGQEVAQPDGLTIQVTTFTDGSRSAVKVVK